MWWASVLKLRGIITNPDAVPRGKPKSRTSAATMPSRLMEMGRPLAKGELSFHGDQETTVGPGGARFLGDLEKRRGARIGVVGGDTETS